MNAKTSKAVQAEPAKNAIALSNVHFSWTGRDDDFALTVPAFDVARGERVCLVGPSGGGKSTLLGLVCGSLVPQRGDVAVMGETISAMGGAARDRFRSEKIGLIFQQFNLLPYLSVLDNVLLPLRFSKTRREAAGADGPVQRETAKDVCERLGIGGEFLRRKAALLSVGQQQRVAAARAFLGAPPLIVADEPTSALDADRRAVFMDMLLEQASETGATLLVVSHDEALAERFDRVVSMDTWGVAP
ncbi:MAG: ABC transporter ATP-binding protein [Pseudomonadota bacterium]